MKSYIAAGETLRLDESKCTGCGFCVKVCPHAVFSIEDRKAQPINSDKCIECGACMQNCAFGAINVRVGVGCAAAVIGGFFSRGEPSCGCGNDNSESVSRDSCGCGGSCC